MHGAELPDIGMVNGAPVLIEVPNEIRQLIAEARVDPWLRDDISRDLSFNEKRISPFLFAEALAVDIPAAAWTALFDLPQLGFPVLEAGIHLNFVGTGTSGLATLRFSVYDFSGGVQPRPCLYHGISWGASNFNTDDLIQLPYGAHGLRVEIYASTLRNGCDFRLIGHPFRIHKGF